LNLRIISVYNENLVAYYTTQQNKKINYQIFKDNLRSLLPSYMVPTIFKLLKEIPINKIKLFLAKALFLIFSIIVLFLILKIHNIQDSWNFS
jgi:hypothetical protein